MKEKKAIIQKLKKKRRNKRVKGRNRKNCGRMNIGNSNYGRPKITGRSYQMEFPRKGKKFFK